MIPRYLSGLIGATRQVDFFGTFFWAGGGGGGGAGRTSTIRASCITFGTCLIIVHYTVFWVVGDLTSTKRSPLIRCITFPMVTIDKFSTVPLCTRCLRFEIYNLKLTLTALKLQLKPW